MKNKLSLGLISSLCLLSACNSTELPKGFDATSAQADTIISDAFYPDPNYNYNYKNKNNFIVLDLRLDPIDSTTTPMPDGINAESIQAALQNEFQKSKRFTVLDKAHEKDASMHLKVRANITYSEITTKSRMSIGYEVRMAFVGINTDGVQEFAMTVNGGAADYFDKNFMGDYVCSADTMSRLLMSSVDKCFNQVFPELVKAYPVSGLVVSARDTGKATFLTVNRDANDGMVQAMPFVVAYTDVFNNKIFIARAHAVDIGTGYSQIIIDAWNEDAEPSAVAYAKSKIAQGDKAFIDSMFFVSKYRPYKKN